MKIVLLLYITLLFLGCYSSAFQQKANIPAINQQILLEEDLNFITPGKKEYQLIVEQIDTLHVEGTGKMRQNSSAKWEDYKGAIPIDSIEIAPL